MWNTIGKAWWQVHRWVAMGARGGRGKKYSWFEHLWYYHEVWWDFFQHACNTGESCCLLFFKKLILHILISLAAFVASTLLCHGFAYCTGLQWMTNYNIDFLPALVCCNKCTVIVKSQASKVKNGRTASVLNGCNGIG